MIFDVYFLKTRYLNPLLRIVHPADSSPLDPHKKILLVHTAASNDQQIPLNQSFAVF
jgi:hypothetical protein